MNRNNKSERKSTAIPVAKDHGARTHIQMLVLMAATILGIYLCYRMAVPFLPAITWALTLAVLFSPVQRRLESKRIPPGLSALISISLAILIVAVPAAFMGQRLVQQAAKSAELIKVKVESGEWQRAIETQPNLAPIVNMIERHIDLPGTMKTLAGWLTNVTGEIIKGSVFQMIGVCMTFYLLFFFLRDRRLALQSLRSLSPLPTADTDRLFNRVADTIYAMIYGTLVVSVLQGFLGGLMFWWLGLSAPLFWGLMMALLALVPVLGVFVIWIPAAIFLALEGSWDKALILSLWGGIVVGGIDNLLRPILVGNRLKLHTILTFMSVIGGLFLFGSAGIILGPVTLTVIKVLLEFWRGRIRTEVADFVELEAMP